jgi:hypothetical protein
VHHQAVVAFALALGFGFALSTASCGPTCSGGAQSCGTTNASTAGAAGSTEDTTTCDQLSALRACMDSFCATASNPFCTCYNRGHLDISVNPCSCIAFDSAKFCQQAADNGIDAASYDCSAATASVATICVAVQ